MKTILSCSALLLISSAALAADFAPGDRVHIASSNADGTVLAVGQKLSDGGTYIKVHVDGAAYPAEVGIMYDSAMSRISVTGHGAAPAQAAQATAPANARVASNNQPVGRAPANAANCQQAIRANYISTGDDQTIQVSFTGFTVSGPSNYESVYKNDKMLGARGHVMQALTIHAQYKVLTHFADVNADDQLRTYDGNFKCYNTVQTGELVAEMTERLGGSEHATYIHKR